MWKKNVVEEYCSVISGIKGEAAMGNCKTNEPKQEMK